MNRVVTVHPTHNEFGWNEQGFFNFKEIPVIDINVQEFWRRVSLVVYS